MMDMVQPEYHQYQQYKDTISSRALELYISIDTNIQVRALELYTEVLITIDNLYNHLLQLLSRYY